MLVCLLGVGVHNKRAIPVRGFYGICCVLGFAILGWFELFCCVLQLSVVFIMFLLGICFVVVWLGDVDTNG